MSCGIVVFAKAPVPGRVKTRLIPALGAEGAARLAERMLAHTLAMARAAALGPVVLCIGGGRRHPGLRELAKSAGVPLWSQGRGGLGRRMAGALERMRVLQPRAILVGTDVPALDVRTLRAAAAALAEADAVFGPTADGGFALVGLARAAPGLFDRMRWSHSGVMQSMRDRLGAAGLRWRELALLHDVDTTDDLRRLPAGWL